MVNTIILKPAIWCIRVYDDFWAPRLRRAPNLIHEIASSGQSMTSVSPPTPLPRNRKRALTNPLLEIDVEHGLSYSIRRARQRNHEQAESLFITMLPQELRALVYCEILTCGDKPLIHVMRKATKFGHWRCRLQGTQEVCDAQNRRCFEGFLTYRSQQRQMDLTGRLEVKTDAGLLSFLLTCRVVYSEAINLLYSRNIFHFYDPGDIYHFSRTILAHRWNTIQFLKIDWERPYSIFNKYNTIPKRGEKEYMLWSRAWEIISQMENLRDVKIVLRKHKYNVPQARREKMCGPMMAMEGLRTFDLRVPWDDPTDWKFAEDAPFLVVKDLPPASTTTSEG